jgi:hypothetical protein
MLPLLIETAAAMLAGDCVKLLPDEQVFLVVGGQLIFNGHGQGTFRANFRAAAAVDAAIKVPFHYSLAVFVDYAYQAGWADIGATAAAYAFIGVYFHFAAEPILGRIRFGTERKSSGHSAGLETDYRFLDFTDEHVKIL